MDRSYCSENKTPNEITIIKKKQNHVSLVAWVRVSESTTGCSQKADIR